MKKITPADISDPQEVIVRAKAPSVELGRTRAAGYDGYIAKPIRYRHSLATIAAHLART